MELILLKKTKIENEYTKFKLLSDRALNENMITDMDDIILYCNTYCANSHKYEINEVVGKKKFSSLSKRRY